jgi:DNA-binding transcriptional ArsR family regulator
MCGTELVAASRTSEGDRNVEPAVHQDREKPIARFASEAVSGGEAVGNSLVDSASPCEPAKLARVLLALADPIRIRMMNLMLHQEVTSQQFAGVLARGPSVIYRHLTYLRGGKLLATRRHGRITHYVVRESLSSTESNLLRLTVESLKAHSGLLQADIDRLNLISTYDSRRGTPEHYIGSSTDQEPLPIVPDDHFVPESVLVDSVLRSRQSDHGRA